jgi:drug/metabolite transporter (DMT)-like permease
MSSRAKGTILIILSALMFGSYGVWSKLIGTELGLFYPGWTRSLLISIVLLPVLLYRKEIVRIDRKDWGWLTVFLTFTSLTQAPLFYAFNHMDIGSATLLFFVSMLLTMYMVGFLFLGERVTKVKVSSFLIAIIGLYFTFSFSVTAFAVIAACMAILNGIASGGEISFSKKLPSKYSVLYVTWLSWIIIAITNGAISIAIDEAQPLPMLSLTWLYQLGFATAGVLGFWLVIEGLRFVEASIGGLLGLIEIVFSLLLGIIIFHEALSGQIIFGAILILVAAALPHMVELQKQGKALF